jgi:hypothetical protein
LSSSSHARRGALLLLINPKSISAQPSWWLRRPHSLTWGGVRRHRAAYSDQKVANRNARDFGWEIAHAAVTRRPPISLYTMVPRTGGYTYDVGLWDSSIVQGPFSAAPCQTLTSRFATVSSLCSRAVGRLCVVPAGLCQCWFRMKAYIGPESPIFPAKA